MLFRLHSPHACLVGDGLSFGSILCIIFSLLVVLYFAGGNYKLVRSQYGHATQHVVKRSEDQSESLKVVRLARSVVNFQQMLTSFKQNPGLKLNLKPQQVMTLF